MKRPHCLLCGQPSVAQHHLTGRRLDPSLATPVCHDHHYFVHDDWWTHGVGAKPGNDEQAPPTVLHAMHLRLRRLAMFLGRLVELGLFRPLSDWLAEALSRWGDEMQSCVIRLDADGPSWRSTLRWPAG